MTILKEKQNIPEGWFETTLEKECEVLKGKGLSKDVINQDGKYECVLYGELFTTYEEIINSIKSRTDKKDGMPSVVGDVLIPGSTTTVAKDLAIASSLNREKVLLGGDINILRKKKDSYDSNFLAYYLTHYKKKELSRFAQGITIIHLSGNKFKQLDICIPKSKKEQKKIAEILGAVDEDIAKTQGVIDTTEKLKRGLMQKLFTRGIGHTKFKKTKLGEIPEGWEVKPFEKFAVLQRGFDLPVQDRSIGQYDLVTSNGVTDKHNQFKVKGPGVVTGRSGTLGNVFYVENDFWPLNTTLYIKDFHGNHVKFVYYKIKSFDIRRFGTGTGVPTLNRNIVHKELVAVPKYHEQQKITEILSAVDEKISVNKKLLAKLTKLKKGLMQDLLSGQKRVI
ncbi:MAG: restriction endonuclease subunit S [Candidatus Pacebacteria bacterium]|nr:restriction endonuclease subunit S [Candidatus Paceibacterota bacterium]